MGDVINGSFELVGGLLIWLSVRRLWLDGEVKGVSVLPTVFWSVWGFWNLWYYPSLDQWCSFAGGVFVVTANVAWLVLLCVLLTRSSKGGNGCRS